MPRQSAIKRLPADMKKELERKILENDYESFAALAEWAKEHGATIHKSTLHRHKQKLVDSNVLLEWEKKLKEPGKMNPDELEKEKLVLSSHMARIKERHSAIRLEIIRRYAKS